MKLRGTIRVKFAVLALLVILASSVLTSAIGYSISRSAVSRKIEEFDLVNLVTARALDIETRLGRGIESSIILAHDATLAGWFRSGERDAALGELARANMRTLGRKGNYANVFAASAVTRAFWVDGKERPADILSINDPDDTWFFRTIAEKRPFNLNIDYNRQLDNTFIFVNVLMGDPGNPDGVAGVGIELSSFAREFSIRDNHGGKSWLVAADGRIQISRDLDLIGRRADEIFGTNAAARISSITGGAIVLRTPSGQGMLAEDSYLACARVPSAGWLVVYQIPESSLSGILETMRISSLLGAAVSGLLVVLLFLYGFTTIMNPLKQLARAMRSFGGGDLSCRVSITSDDELGQIGERFNEMAETLSKYNTELESIIRQRTAQLVRAEKMASLGELVAGVSHEINTPVGIGVTAASDAQRRLAILRQSFADGTLTRNEMESYMETAESALEMTRSNLERAAELVQSFKRVAVDRAAADIREIVLDEYLDDVLRSLKPRFKKTSHIVETDCPPGIVMRTLPGAISQIITNLVINSLVHGFADRAEGLIRIQVAREDPMVRIVFSDNGAGIPPSHIGRIFEPFFTTRRGSGGSGLGLNIVWNLVTHSLGGSIDCSTGNEGGVVFTLRLPIALRERDGGLDEQQ